MRVVQPRVVVRKWLLLAAFADQLSRRGCPSTPSQSACKASPVKKEKEKGRDMDRATVLASRQGSQWRAAHALLPGGSLAEPSEALKLSEP